MLDHGRARLIGGAGLPGATGAYVLGLLDHHDPAGAARWLGVYVEDVQAQALQKMGGVVPPTDLTSLYKAAAAKAGARPPPGAIIETLAASALAMRQPARALPHLHRCRLSDPMARLSCQAVRMDAAMQLHRWREAADAARAVADAAPTPEVAAMATAGRAGALAALGKRADAVRLTDDALAKAPDSELLRRTRAILAIAAGRWQDAQPSIAKVVDLPHVSWGSLNDMAWARLYYDPDPTEALALGERAEHEAGGKPSTHLGNTLAAIHAEAGDPVAAWRYLQAVLSNRPDGIPTTDDWFVIGRIAQDYGLRDDAIAAYKKVVKPKEPQLMPSSYDFARRHLKELGARYRPQSRFGTREGCRRRAAAGRPRGPRRRSDRTVDVGEARGGIVVAGGRRPAAGPAPPSGPAPRPGPRRCKAGPARRGPGRTGRRSPPPGRPPRRG